MSLTQLPGEGHANPADYRASLDPRQIEAVFRLVERSGVGPAFDEEAARINPPKGPGGRKPAMSTTAVFTVMLLLAVLRRPLHAKAAAELVCLDLDDEARSLLGVRHRGPHAVSAATEAVRATLHRSIGSEHCSANPYNRVMTHDEYVASRRPLSDSEVERHRAFVTRQMNVLLHQTIALLPDEVADAMTGDICIDATFVEAFSHGMSEDSEKISSDPDAGWYVRRDKGPPKYGYDVHIGVNTDLTRRSHRAHPTLALGFTVDRPGRAPGDNAMTLVAGVVERTGKAGFLAGDRAYNNSVPQSLQIPAALLGFDMVWDYKSQDLGVQAYAHGAIQVEGTWYCPGMPKALVNASIDHEDRKIDTDTYRGLIEERRKWSIRVKDGPTDNGSWRGACPAASNPGAPRVCCSHKPRSDVGVSIRPRVQKPPKTPGQICVQQAVTFSVTDGAKHRQALPFKSPEWAHAYGVLRNSIESTNSYLKDPAFDGFELAHRHRIRGIGFRIFFSGILITAANMRRVATFVATAEPDDQGALGVKRRARRRVRHDGASTSGAGDRLDSGTAA